MMMKRNTRLILGSILLISEVVKQITLTQYYGHYVWYYFPFQLCSTPMYLLLISGMFEKSRDTIDDFLIDYGLVAGVAVFLDTSGMHYPITWITIHSYLWHLFMIGLALYLSTKKTAGSFDSETWLFLILCGIAVGLNILLSNYGVIDMFYLSPFQPVSQLVFRDIAKYLGNRVTRGIYVLCIVTGANLVHKLRLLLR
ncbi:MAG: YwaF family protein [Erysipelotrichaceae bacterium]|nr:YwaF family protein [Erysipelotrichaceae bacterium]